MSQNIRPISPFPATSVLSTITQPGFVLESARLGITDDLDHVRGRLIAIAAAAQGRYGSPGDPLSQLWAGLGRGLGRGKLVRPSLLLLAAYHNGPPKRLEAVRELAVAVELLHESFLLHDDVIDHDTIRRGEPNLIGQLDGWARQRGAAPATARAYGETAAILGGDLLLARAHDIVARLDIAQRTRIALLDSLEHALEESVNGELYDSTMSHGTSIADTATVSRMLYAKTGAYTVRLPLNWAFIITDTPIPADFDRFCRALGLAFQLQDDLLELFGHPALVGKDPLSDLREGKMTLIMTFAAQTELWHRIEPHLGKSSINDEVARDIVRAVEDSGARSQAEQALMAALDEARTAATSSGPVADVLHRCVDIMADRAA